MSITGVGPPSAGHSTNRRDYRSAFIGEVLVLVQMGYDRLDSSSYSRHAEEEITGELVKAIKQALYDPDSPEWCDRYGCCEEERINTAKRLGKKRRRVDISFESNEARPRPRFQFEAKPLKDGRSVRAYLGTDGLGCFFAGQDAYAREQDDAGMLGYVQTDDEATWAGRIRDRLMASPKEHHVACDGGWSDYNVTGGPGRVYRTQHDRADPPRALTIFHVLLMFC